MGAGRPGRAVPAARALAAGERLAGGLAGPGPSSGRCSQSRSHGPPLILFTACVSGSQRKHLLALTTVTHLVVMENVFGLIGANGWYAATHRLKTSNIACNGGEFQRN